MIFLLCASTVYETIKARKLLEILRLWLCFRQSQGQGELNSLFDCEDEDGRVRNICVSSTVGRWHRIHVSLGRKQGDSNWHQPSHQFQIHTMGGPCDDLSFNADNSFYLLQSNKTRWSINSRIVFSFLRSIIVFFFILVFYLLFGRFSITFL